MRRVLLTLIAAGNFTVVAAVVHAKPLEPTPSTMPTATLIVAQTSSPPQNPATAKTPDDDDSSLKRYGTLLAIFTVMGAIALRRTRSQRP
jgi:hypothetical protein